VRSGAPATAFSLASLFPVSAWRRVLAIPAAAGYIAGYAVHCMELFGAQAWMVAFLIFANGLHAPGDGFPWSAAAIAAAMNAVSVTASIAGNELALRIGRRRWILMAMTGSSLCGIALALGAALPWPFVLALLLFHVLLVMADSGTLTAGFVAAAPPELKGAAIGLYSLCGFGGGMLGPVLFGLALDAAGGASQGAAWVWGYAAIGAGCLVAPAVVRFALRQPGQT
jgi:MFS family permease